MTKYKIYYRFDGYGQAIIEAENEQEATEKLDNGEWKLNTETEQGENYEITEIETL